MSERVLENGLLPIKLNELSEPVFNVPVSSWTDIKTFAGSTAHLAVFYFDYGIFFSLWDGSKFHFADSGQDVMTDHFKYLQLAHIFNETREVKIWRDGKGKHFFRIREDTNDGNNTNGIDAVMANQNLWGTKTCSYSEKTISRTVEISKHKFDKKIYWTTLTEDRGVELVVPLREKFEIPDNNDKIRLAIQTYHYIDYLPNGLATYADSRFVDIVKREENNDGK
ncbi:TIGR03984 family CRISPR-associated protein [candidate division KSB1 bacterium]|nr:TIGR03984 family CRISPR-associated protein [candidate division KSB1 bacterium]